MGFSLKLGGISEDTLLVCIILSPVWLTPQGARAGDLEPTRGVWTYRLLSTRPPALHGPGCTSLCPPDPARMSLSLYHPCPVLQGGAHLTPLPRHQAAQGGPAEGGFLGGGLKPPRAPSDLPAPWASLPGGALTHRPVEQSSGEPRAPLPFQNVRYRDPVSVKTSRSTSALPTVDFSGTLGCPTYVWLLWVNQYVCLWIKRQLSLSRRVI